MDVEARLPSRFFSLNRFPHSRTPKTYASTWDNPNPNSSEKIRGLFSPEKISFGYLPPVKSKGGKMNRGFRFEFPIGLPIFMQLCSERSSTDSNENKKETSFLNAFQTIRYTHFSDSINLTQQK